MANYILLDNNTHHGLKVSSKKCAEFGDNVMSTTTFLSEFRDVQDEYPILFSKHQSGNQIVPTVLFGLDIAENLFLDNNGWNAHYIPAMVDRLPFLIGFQQQDGQNTPVIFIDIDSPRIVGQEQGESLFLPHGGHTDYIKRMAVKLSAIHQGQAQNEQFIEELVKLDLLITLTLKVQLNNGAQCILDEYMTIDEEKLKSLPDATLGSLHRAGFLESIYMALASLSNIQHLIHKKNQRG